MEVERGHAWGVPWLCLACPFSVPWLGSLSNPWPVAASISVSRRDIYYYVRVYVFTSVFLLSQGNMPRTWDERGMKWKSHRPADTQKVTAMASAIAQPPWPRIKMPSFEAVCICRAEHSIVVQYVLRNCKCKSIVWLDLLNAFAHTHLHIESQVTKRAFLLRCCNFEVWSSTDPWPWMVSEARLEESVKKTKRVKGRQKK